MNRWHGRTARVFAAAVVASVVAGCSSGSGSNASSASSAGGATSGAAATSGGGATTGAKSGPVVNLSFWNGLTGPDKPAIDHIISTFNATHPTIHVTSDPIPWDVLYTKLLPAFGAGKGPDLVGISSDNLPGYASKGVLQPLDTIFSLANINKANIVPSALAAGEYQGKVYGVPVESTPVMLYYNKTMFKAAGIANPPANWTELAADAKKLTLPGGTGGNPKQYGMAIGTNNTVELFPIFLWEANGGILSADGRQVLLNNAGSQQAVEFWANLIKTDQISRPGLTGADADKLITSGTAAMEVNGPWATSGYKTAKIDYGLAPVPTGPNGQHISVGVTTVLGVSATAKADKLKAAAEFYAYWTQPANQAALSLMSGFPPVTKDVPASALASNPDVGAFAAQAGTTRALAPGQTNFASIENDVFDPTIEQIVSDPSKAKSLLDQAASKVQSMINTGG
ncbi:MAG: multiple sugar transport system substrate-binding protein [Frankiales bacterium]|nr:multiple sugar transport system substrate-binding protein [Frankiales bacterium]